MKNKRHFLTLFIWLVGLPCVFSKPYSPVATYFLRRHSNGSLVDQNHPDTRLKFLNDARKVSTRVSQPKAALSVSPSLIANGGLVTVSWSGIQTPTEKDAIVLYCPTDEKPAKYLDYIHVKDYPTYKMGYGSFDVRLYNMRSDCQFRYYRPGTELVALSNVIKFNGGPEEPLQGHLALTSDPSEMRVMWVSGASKLSKSKKILKANSHNI